MKSLKSYWTLLYSVASRHRKISYPLIGFLACFLLFFIWGSFQFSKGRLVDHYLSLRAAADGRFEDIKEYLVWDDTNEVMTSDEARFTRFPAIKSKQKRQQLKKQLLTASSHDDMYLKSVGRRFGLFPDYRVALKPLTLKVKTNLAGVPIFLNQKKLTTSDSENYLFTKDRLPAGDYTFHLDGHYQGKPILLKRSYNGKDKTIDLSVAFRTFTVKSNLQDGELYFGKKQIGTLSDGAYKVDNYPVSDSATVFVKKSFTDGDLLSQKLALTAIEDQAEVQLNVDGLLTDDKANALLQDAFAKFTTFATTGQDPTDLLPLFEEGANNEFYSELKDSVKQKTQIDSRKPSHLTISAPSLTKVRQLGVKTNAISYAVTYTYTYDASTDPEKRTSGNLIQTFIGQLKVKRKGNDYLIDKTGHHAPELYNEDNQLKSPNPIPDSLVGSWQIKKDGDVITISLASDGTVTKRVQFKKDKKEDSVKVAKVSRVEEVSEGLYRYHFESGDKSAFTVMDDIGANDAYQYGFQIKGETMTTVFWKSEDTTTRPEEGIGLKKQ